MVHNCQKSLACLIVNGGKMFSSTNYGTYYYFKSLTEQARIIIANEIKLNYFL